MSESHYEVTARKYRPQTFADVVGQEHVTRTLQNALSSGQIHHAYLFAGPRGTGKTTTARLLAKALNCKSSDGMVAEPCGECASCRAIARGSSIDVQEIDGASNNSVDQIRDLRDTLAYASLEGRYKIYIIDEVHMLSTQAFNAMLKTLEEPPKHVVFVFATTEPGKVIPTIMSRVQRYDFRRIGIGDITSKLTEIAEREGIASEPEALHMIARKADGALRDAESLFDQVRAFTAEGESITLSDTRTVLGLLDADLYFRLTALSSDVDAAGVLAFSAELAEQGADPREFLLAYAEHLRHLAAASVGGEAGLESLSDSERARYLKEKDRLSLEDYLRRLEYVGRKADEIRHSSQPWIALETVFLRLATMDRSVDLGRLLERIEQESGGGKGVITPPEIEMGETPRPAAPASKREPAPAPVGGEPPDAEQPRLLRDAEPTFETLPPTEAYREDLESSPEGSGAPSGGNGGAGAFEQVRAHWKDVLEELHRRKVTLSVFLQEAHLAGLEENRLLLVFRGTDHNFHINTVTRHEALIREVTRDILGHGYGVRCVKSDRPAHEGTESRPGADLNEKLLARLCEDDPSIRHIVELFDARLEDGPGGRPS